ncbi:hypothetical protein [uncultured Psychrobacter sp.]|uniref:hypothetical protein n=1 Tax=uncultured Psychrobacter sp. TaxID=259303 RepID=UPI00345B0BC7
MLIIARNNVEGESIDEYYSSPSLTPEHCYEIIGMEYEYYRIVNDYLDPVLVHPIFCKVQNYKNVNEWVADIRDDHFFLTPKEFNIYPYFFEYLHDGSLEYVNVYMQYLGKLFGTSTIKSKIYAIYKQVLDEKQPRISYWLKEWMKSLFGVEKALELRAFNKNDWEKKLSNFFKE